MTYQELICEIKSLGLPQVFENSELNGYVVICRKN